MMNSIDIVGFASRIWVMNELVEICERVRDIPYEIGPLYEGEKLIEYGRGGCGPKSRYLAECISRLGYKVKVCRTPYRWKDLDVLPDELKNMSKAERVGNHAYLKVNIESKWVLIDPGWDKELSPTLPANIHWDGVSNQIPAVRILEETCMNFPEPYLTWRSGNQNSQKITDEERLFANQMNKWFESIRSAGRQA